MTRWLKKRRLWFREFRRDPVWSEPALPPYVKFNPEGVNPEPGELQPGDISMAKAAEEFLAEDEPGGMNGDLHLRMEDLENAACSSRIRLAAGSARTYLTRPALASSTGPSSAPDKPACIARPPEAKGAA